jgi:hypothetical protein
MRSVQTLSCLPLAPSLITERTTDSTVVFRAGDRRLSGVRGLSISRWWTSFPNPRFWDGVGKAWRCSAWGCIYPDCEFDLLFDLSLPSLTRKRVGNESLTKDQDLQVWHPLITLLCRIATKKTTKQKKKDVTHHLSRPTVFCFRFILFSGSSLFFFSSCACPVLQVSLGLTFTLKLLGM